MPCVCSVTDYRRRQNVVRTSVTHETQFLPHFDVNERGKRGETASGKEGVSTRDIFLLRAAYLLPPPPPPLPPSERLEQAGWHADSVSDTYQYEP